MVPAPSARSAGPPLQPDTLVFGVECEFTDPRSASVSRDQVPAYRQAVLDLARTRPGLRVREHHGSGLLLVRRSDGLQLRLHPHRDEGVLEVATGPLPLAVLVELEADLQVLLWQAAARIGLAPGTEECNRWSAHLNVSWPGLRRGDDAGLLLRFLVDFHQFPELAMGGLGGDIRNAPPLALFGERPQRALRRLIGAFERHPERFDAFSLAARIRRRVYRERFLYGSRLGNRDFQAINLHAVRRRPCRKWPHGRLNDVRLELRSCFMPPTAGHLITSLRLLQARLLWLSEQGGPIRHQPPNDRLAAGRRRFEPRGLQQGCPAERVVSAWARFVAEAGLDPADFAAQLVHPEVRREALARFGHSS